jgi:hypothetical protein
MELNILYLNFKEDILYNFWIFMKNVAVSGKF